MNLIHLRTSQVKACRRLLWISAILITALPAAAQQNSIHQDADLLLKKATALYKRGLYSDAQPLLKKRLDQIDYFKATEHQLSAQDAAYYYIVCAFKLNQPHAVSQAEAYIKNTSSIAHRQMMSYQLGHYYFQNNQFQKAVPYYEQAGIDNLSNEEIAKAKFEQAYSYLNLKQFDKAYPLFNAIKNIHNEYFLPANYYTGYISLYKKDYDNAFRSFQQVVDDPQYKRVVPYYIAEIYYYKHQYDKLLDYAQPYLEKGDLYYDADLRHLVGQTYFELKQYEKALPYLASYEKQAKTLQKEDVYELAYCYYKTNQLDKAIAGFKQLSGGTDSLAQNSMYILGDCYLKTGQKAEARHAFAFCARSSYNPTQQEISKFNYGKLSYELGYQEAALKTLQAFITDYPSSEYSQEAREILAQLFMNTADYKNALAVLTDLPKNSRSVKEAYQRVTFGRAMQLVNDGDLTKADQLLDESLKDPLDRKLRLLAYFWKGEIALRNNHPDEAIRYLELYIPLTNRGTPPALGEANIQTAHYNLGYSYLKKEQYQKALSNFKQAQRVFGANGAAIANDARLREADCYYMLKNYDKAVELYNLAIANGGAGSDYALYQKGIISGITGDNFQKVSILNKLSSRYPGSGYQNEANYQIGLTYMNEGKYRTALPYLQKVAGDNNNPNASKALLKLALAHYHLNNTEEAINSYKKLIRQYPNSAEGQEAMTSLQNLYINAGQPQAYFAFLKSIGRTVNTSVEDSVTYASAESSFADGKYNNAIQQFSNYITRYPQGRYTLKAHFYRAESAYKQENFSQALKDYQYVLSQGAGMFNERAASQAAAISFYQQKDYQQALKHYQQLKQLSTSKENTLAALRGVLRSTYELQQWNQVKTAAQHLLALENISTGDQIVAYFYLGRAAQAQQDCPSAIQHFNKVAGMTTSELGAEARYYIALCNYEQGQLKDAESAAFDVIKKTPSYDFWVAKAYILLGEVFWKENDYFNAKATLQSIVDHCKIPALVKEADALLDKVKADENAHSKIVDTPAQPAINDTTKGNQ